MKVISKKHILDEDKVEQIISERKILTSAAADHPFIVQLHCAFTSKSNLYLVLDLCSGGELFYYISKVFGKFEERRAKLCFAELLLAIERLHSQGILYRDMKPENVLVDAEGHLRLADFGLSKQGMFGQEDLTMTFCGSPEYMAPEMLRMHRSNKGHGLALDFYQLGALLYEMLTGLPPFYNSSNRIKMYQDIMDESTPSFPRGLSGEVIDLLSKLLEKNPEKRLSDIEMIKQHPFFQGIDWKKIYRREEEPPIKVNYNVSNFDSTYTKMSININADEEDFDLYDLNTTRRRTKSFTDFSLAQQQLHTCEDLDEVDESHPFEKAKDISATKLPLSNYMELPINWQERAVTPTFREFLYKRVSKEYGTASSAENSAEKLSKLREEQQYLYLETPTGLRSTRVNKPQKINAVEASDQMMAESILEVDEVTENATNTNREVQPILILEDSNITPLIMDKQQKLTRMIVVKNLHAPLERRSIPSQSIYIETAFSKENSPNFRESARVQRVIEENFNWQRAFNNDNSVILEQRQQTSADLLLSGNGSSSRRHVITNNRNSYTSQDLGLRRCPSSKKNTNLLQYFIETTGFYTTKHQTSTQESFEGNEKGQGKMQKKLSTAQLISFTEKANGIFSERNREKSLLNIYKTQENHPTSEEIKIINEKEDNAARLRKQGYNTQVSSISEIVEGEGSSGSEKIGNNSCEHLSEEGQVQSHSGNLQREQRSSGVNRPSTKIVQYKCRAKDPTAAHSSSSIANATLGVPKQTISKRTPNDSFLGSQIIEQQQSITGKESFDLERLHVHHISQSSMAGYSSKMIMGSNRSSSSKAINKTLQVEGIKESLRCGEDQLSYQLKSQEHDIFSPRPNDDNSCSNSSSSDCPKNMFDREMKLFNKKRDHHYSSIGNSYHSNQKSNPVINIDFNNSAYINSNKHDINSPMISNQDNKNYDRNFVTPEAPPQQIMKPPIQIENIDTTTTTQRNDHLKPHVHNEIPQPSGFSSHVKAIQPSNSQWQMQANKYQERKDISKTAQKKSPRHTDFIFSSNKKPKFKEDSMEIIAKSIEIMISPGRPSLQPFCSSTQTKTAAGQHHISHASYYDKTPSHSKNNKTSNLEKRAQTSEKRNSQKYQQGSQRQSLAGSTTVCRTNMQRKTPAIGSGTARSLNRVTKADSSKKMFSQPKATGLAHKESSPHSQPILQILSDEPKSSIQQLINGPKQHQHQPQTLRKIDIINREKQSKGSSTTKEGGSSIQLRIAAESNKHLGGKTPTKSGRNQPGFNQFYLGQYDMLDKQINCSDINTMQSSVTEFDVENFNDYDIIKQSFTSSIEALDNYSQQQNVVDAKAIGSPYNKQVPISSLKQSVNQCKEEHQIRNLQLNSASQCQQSYLKNQEANHVKELNKATQRVPSTFSSNRRQETVLQKSVNDLHVQLRISNKERVQTFSAEKTPNSRRQTREDTQNNDFSEQQNPLQKVNHPSLFSAKKKPLERLLSPSGHSKTSLQSITDLQMPTIDLTEAHHYTSSSNPGPASYITNIQSKMTQLRVISLTTKSSTQTSKVDLKSIHKKQDGISTSSKKKPHHLQVVITKEANASKPHYLSMTPKVTVVEKQNSAGISFQEQPKYAAKTIQTQQSSSSSSQGVALSANEKQ